MTVASVRGDAGIRAGERGFRWIVLGHEWRSANAAARARGGITWWGMGEYSVMVSGVGDEALTP